jgi:CDP-glycerol glycerophosphotransferase
MDRPMIFYNYDYKEYASKRDFLFDYVENTPGPKLQQPELVLNAIEEYFISPEKDMEFRQQIKNKFHSFTDGKACARTHQLIKSLL